MPGLIGVASSLSGLYGVREARPCVGQVWEWHGSQISFQFR